VWPIPRGAGPRPALRNTVAIVVAETLIPNLWGKEIRSARTHALVIAAAPVQTRVVLMSLLYRLLCGVLGLLVRHGGERELEIIVLRHQLAILSRGSKRPQFTTADRALLSAASRLLPRQQGSCFVVSPQTLRRWHRALLQGNRRRRGRRPGRPPQVAPGLALVPPDVLGPPTISVARNDGTSPRDRIDWSRRGTATRLP
jgi:hypothetical protein